MREESIKTETVILVHGLWTPAAVFALHGRWLQRRGYRALRFGYPSVRGTLSQNARSVGLGRVGPGLPRPNDGVVALAETRLPGAADCIALPEAHSEMLASRRCAVQIAMFLQTGRFLHDERV